MLDKKQYGVICTSWNELQEPFSLEFHPELRAALGKSVSEIFPAFSQAFPLTVTAIEKHWPTPIGAFINFRNRWQPFLVCEREDLNLFFHLRIPNFPIEGVLYNQSHMMLPVRWMEIYRYFESFVITPDSIKPMDWINTPFNYPSRLSMDEYCHKISNAKKADFKKFAKDIGGDSAWLRCWLYTEAGDALFLDEKRNDHKVYHVRNNVFDDLYVLKNSEDTLDRYLAHYVSGGAPADFDFRVEL